jgi:CPA1 family monovalent cation:H+ antiporter
MLFGAILSPTDPIAVLSIIKSMRAPKIIETTIVGESLFNDGVAIVLFLTIIELSNPAKHIGALDVILFALQEIGGGLLFGGFLGMLAHGMLGKVNDFDCQLLITLAVVTGGYASAEYFGFSAPLAMVVAGIIIGNRKSDHRSTHQIKRYLNAFWEAIDNVLNASLFFLIGMEMLVITTTTHLTLLSIACIPIALISRFISVALPLNLIKPFHAEPKGTSTILTWGGLRGALSIAMVLSLTSDNTKILLLPCIYSVVIFSIAVQGLTFGKLLKPYLENFNHRIP